MRFWLPNERSGGEIELAQEFEAMVCVFTKAALLCRFVRREPTLGIYIFC
jgi:hypothetical protein